jgi:hypothetical protein
LYGNLCCNVTRFGCSLVINEYSSFWMLSSGSVICGFSEWNFIYLCWVVGRDFGLSIKFLIRFVVHWMWFSAIN